MTLILHVLFFQVVFESIVGSGFLGDTAVDDVSITNGACSGSGKTLLLVFHILVYEIFTNMTSGIL